MTPDRLSELETYAVDDDTPDDAKIRIPAGDLRDLVRLIPYARKAAQLEEILAKTEKILSATVALVDRAGKLAERPCSTCGGTLTTVRFEADGKITSGVPCPFCSPGSTELRKGRG